MTFPSQIIKRGNTGIVPLPSLHCWNLPPLLSRHCVRSTLDGVVFLLFSWICSEGTFCLGSLCSLGVLMGDQQLLGKKPTTTVLLMKYILEAVGTSRFFSSFKLKQICLWLAWPVFSDPRTLFYILQIKFSSEYKESNKQNLKKNLHAMLVFYSNCFKFFNFMWMRILAACMYMHHMHALWCRS